MRLNLRPLGAGVSLCMYSCWPWPPARFGRRTRPWRATATGLQSDFIRVAQQAMPSVVSLKAIRVVTMRPPGGRRISSGAPLLKAPFGRGGQPVQRRQVGQGSGVIIDPRGYILTNNHVVAGSQQILVHLYDGRELQGRVIGTDPRFDVALVHVQAQGLKAARLGDSTQPAGRSVGHRHRQPLRPGANHDRGHHQRHRP